MGVGPEWGPLARLAGIWEGDAGEGGKLSEHLSHTDSNTLYRIADA